MGHWLHHMTRATQAFLHLDIPPWRGLAQDNVSLAPLDGGSHVGWSVYDATPQRKASSSVHLHSGPELGRNRPSGTGYDSGQGENPQFRSSTTAWRENRPGAPTRTDTARPSRGRGGYKTHIAGSQTPGRSPNFSPARHKGPECGVYHAATSTPSSGGRGSRAGNWHTADTVNNSSTSHGKRKPSPRLTDRTARRRVMSTRHYLSSSTSSTPTRPLLPVGRTA